MRALVLAGRGAAPATIDWPDPSPQAGADLIQVRTAGLGGWDVVGAYRLGMEFPCVVRGEGVGVADDGRRVYFGERSLLPYGALAEFTVVPCDEVWSVPDEVDDATAILMGIAGTGIVLPLEAASLQPGDRLLVLGGTGALGRLALQLGRHFGAGQIVAAARNEQALDEVVAAGMADASVALTGDGDGDKLRAASGGGGFDVVLDLVYGAPFEAALAATRWGARLVTVGTLAGPVASVRAADMLYRTHTTVGTGQRRAAERRAVWMRLLDLAADLDLCVPTSLYGLEEGSKAWEHQAASPHGKVLVRVSDPSGPDDR